MGRTDVVKTLLQAGANTEVVCRDSAHSQGMTALHVATVRGNAGVVRALLEAGACIEAGGRNSFLWACKSHVRKEVLKALLDAEPDTEARDNEGFTALHLATREGDASAVRMLLEAGASKEAQTPDGTTALDMAKAAGRSELVALLQGGEDPGSAAQ
ncbi:hypothetical protein HYH03_012273 [Edaphochlamys debaryana]|uniref:Ankyrin repeat protein n=1 Tax=Edaphochlamys debaryana TaxID=47281 RepID=A0A836BVP6_9CHLO|nr:hypothetical protein HYH03_012273 [Edaphochlamys debaryana]|eukprot:KAG2489253.1 hypothetical protein HYH03_012273 [Edaphochlamys debaryana]